MVGQKGCPVIFHKGIRVILLLYKLQRFHIYQMHWKEFNADGNPDVAFQIPAITECQRESYLWSITTLGHPVKASFGISTLAGIRI